MTPVSFAQYGPEISSAEAKALFNPAGYCHVGVSAWYSVVIAEHPQVACTVIHLEGS